MFGQVFPKMQHVNSPVLDAVVPELEEAAVDGALVDPVAAELELTVVGGTLVDPVAAEVEPTVVGEPIIKLLTVAGRVRLNRLNLNYTERYNKVHKKSCESQRSV